MEDLGNRMRTMRLGRGLRLQDVADRAHMDKSTISLYESGARTPSLPALRAIAQVLNVSLASLLGEIQAPEPSETDPDARVPTQVRHRDDGCDEDLPQEAKKSIEEFKEFIRHKYGGKGKG